MTTRVTVALSGAASFAALSFLVGVGALDGVDRYSVHHLMPELTPTSAAVSLTDGLRPYRGHFAPEDAITVGAGLLPAALLVLTATSVLRRRGAPASRRWPVLFLQASAVEVLCKETVERGRLTAGVHGRIVHVAAFDSSFPSGHALRATVLAGAVAAAWPRLRTLAAAWVVAVGLTLEVTGAHTPSDVAGGLLLGGTLLLAGQLAEGRILNSVGVSWTRRPSTRTTHLGDASQDAGRQSPEEHPSPLRREIAGIHARGGMPRVEKNPTPDRPLGLPPTR